jgi:hypothetical protein
MHGNIHPKTPLEVKCQSADIVGRRVLSHQAKEPEIEGRIGKTVVLRHLRLTPVPAPVSSDPLLKCFEPPMAKLHGPLLSASFSPEHERTVRRQRVIDVPITPFYGCRLHKGTLHFISEVIGNFSRDLIRYDVKYGKKGGRCMCGILAFDRGQKLIPECTPFRRIFEEKTDSVPAGISCD